MFSNSFKRQSFLIALLCLAACGLLWLGTEARYIKRNAVNDCSSSTPCMWEVYRPNDRKVTFVVPSPCNCKNGTTCKWSSDDISLSAYVYNCVPEGTTALPWPQL